MAGADYRAQDPELLRWVFATTTHTDLLVYSRYVVPLSPAEQECYQQEGKQLARLLGIPGRLVPERLSDLCDYVDATVASDTRGLALTPIRRQLYERSPALVRGLLPFLPETVRHLPRRRAQADCMGPEAGLDRHRRARPRSGPQRVAASTASARRSSPQASSTAT